MCTHGYHLLPGADRDAAIAHSEYLKQPVVPKLKFPRQVEVKQRLYKNLHAAVAYGGRGGTNLIGNLDSNSDEWSTIGSRRFIPLK